MKYQMGVHVEKMRTLGRQIKRDVDNLDGHIRRSEFIWAAICIGRLEVLGMQMEYLCRLGQVAMAEEFEKHADRKERDASSPV